MDLNEQLLTIFADLMSAPAHEDLLVRLFASPKNTWQTLREVCLASIPLRLQLSQLALGRHSEPMVIWLDDVPGFQRIGYCIVLCYWEEEGVESVATFNKEALVRRIALRDGGVSLRPHSAT